MYKPLTDKEMINALENSGNYEMAFRIKELKKEVANLKRKLTKLTNWTKKRNLTFF